MAHIPPRFFNQPYQQGRGTQPNVFPPGNHNNQQQRRDGGMHNQDMPMPYRAPPMPGYQQNPPRGYNGEMASQPNMMSQAFGFSQRDGGSQPQQRLGSQPHTQTGRGVRRTIVFKH
jgi:hypothetical protein